MSVNDARTTLRFHTIKDTIKDKKIGNCTCRVDPEKVYRYVCRRFYCEKPAKACGGYCSECFAFLMSRPPRPEVVVLCGSTRFSEAWAKARYDLTLEGKIVLTIGCDTKSDEGLGITPEQKEMLDELHKRKIDMADTVLVLNVGGYIGASTQSEIDYATRLEKPIQYLVPMGTCGHCGQLVAIREGHITTHDWPNPMRQVCPGSKRVPLPRAV